MPSTSQQSQKNSQPKKRLGRGLGSLLTTGAADFEEVTTQEDKLPQPPAKEVNSKPKPAAELPPVPSKSSLKAEPKQETVEEKASQISNIDISQRVWSLAIEKVVPNKKQPRKDFDKEALEELAQSIRSQGIIQPITVRKIDSGYEIIAGERRWRASQLAGLKEIPAIIKNVDDQKVMELALIENLQREDLNPLEEAFGYNLLIEQYELTQAELAEKVGKSRSSVTNSLRILTLPTEVQQMVRSGDLSLGHAKVLLALGDPLRQKILAKKTLQKKWSVRALEKELKTGPAAQSNSIDGLDMGQKLAQQVASKLQTSIGTKVGIQYKKGRGKLEIHFYSDEELSGLYEKIKEALSPYNQK
jgi:ParB family transcriptional regulator, chromosome partitioning protein